MHKIYIFLISFLISIFLISSCNDPVTPEQDAVIKTWDELTTTFGYGSYATLYSYYTPQSLIVDSINSEFQPDDQKFLIFVEPECSCKETVKEPAYLIKILNEASVPDTCFEIFSMGSENSRHPHSGTVQIKKLPAVFLISSPNRIYSVLDSFSYWRDRQKVTYLEETVLNMIRK